MSERIFCLFQCSRNQGCIQLVKIQVHKSNKAPPDSVFLFSLLHTYLIHHDHNVTGVTGSILGIMLLALQFCVLIHGLLNRRNSYGLTCGRIFHECDNLLKMIIIIGKYVRIGFSAPSPKGQLTSKCSVGVFKSPKKQKKIQDF